tara:strand:+ start:848 stop:1021 length:174 start_codon:yes stop_codon:yes gene_type:complete
MIMSKDNEILAIGIYIGFAIGVTIMMLISHNRDIRLMEKYNITIEYEEDHYEDMYQY